MQPTYPPPPPPPYPYYPPPQPPRKSTNVVLWVVLGMVGFVVVLGILAAIAIPAFLGYQRRARHGKAELQLQNLERALKGRFVEMESFPTESTGLTPPTPCCESSSRKCEVDMSQWMDEPWSSLGFYVDEPSYFQFDYQGDPSGQSFVAHAVGDLDCDGTTVTYELRGHVDPSGGPVFDMVTPPNQD